jgi:hypothetical protein
MDKLTWTTETPTVPGWYWWRNNTGYEAVVNVVRMPAGQLYFYVPDVSKSVESANGEWAGPLEPPTR